MKYVADIGNPGPAHLEPMSPPRNGAGRLVAGADGRWRANTITLSGKQNNQETSFARHGMETILPFFDIDRHEEDMSFALVPVQGHSHSAYHCRVSSGAFFPADREGPGSGPGPTMVRFPSERAGSVCRARHYRRKPDFSPAAGKGKGMGTKARPRGAEGKRKTG